MWPCTPEILSGNFAGMNTRLWGHCCTKYPIMHVCTCTPNNGETHDTSFSALHSSVGAVFIDSLLSAPRKTANQSTNQLSTEKMLSVNSSDERAQTVVIDSSVSCE